MASGLYRIAAPHGILKRRDENLCADGALRMSYFYDSLVGTGFRLLGKLTIISAP